MATIVAGDMYRDLDGQLFEIKRQLRQPNGYPFSPELLKSSLQRIIEGEFNAEKLSIQDAPPKRTEQIKQESTPMFKTSETDLSEWIGHTERFTAKLLGKKVSLLDQFDFPAELPWKNVLLSYDPGLNNREAVQKAIKSQKLDVYEEADVMKYGGSGENDAPTLYVIENSPRPTKDTMGSTPDQLEVDGRLYLPLRGYALAFGLLYFVKGRYLEAATWTSFPKNRLRRGSAYGRLNPYYRGVYFCWNSSDYSNPLLGARLAIQVKPKP
jgi:hypothetical protein